MASSTNTVCQRFFSRFESLNSCGIDLFSQSLDYGEFYFVFPPVSLAIQVLRFLESQKVKGVFIIPLWPTSVWYNSIFFDGAHCFDWVKKLLVFRPNFKFNIHSPSCFAENVTFSCAALHFDFSQSSLGERVVTNRNLCLLGGCDYCWLHSFRIKVFINLSFPNMCWDLTYFLWAFARKYVIAF